jgi:adenylate cyclase
MADEGFKRKLTAILSADAVGYSRLMRDDEAATVRDIAAHRFLITEIIQQHHGRVIDSPGDNILAEFASVVDAVNGAIEIQEEIKRSNTDTPKDRGMEFRIGINLGDVIEEDERIYGDGVNIAARVEGLAAAGGISISGTVYEHIKDKLSLGYHYLGEQNVKNIPEPVSVYRILTKPEDAGKMIGGEKFKSKKFRYAAYSALALIILAFCALVIWNNYFRVKIKPASVDKMAFPLPDKPSIAVLPFVNLSGDPDKEYLSEGLTEEIINALSKSPRFFVIARDSTFPYKEKAAKIQQVAEALGVQYVLEGSVQWAGDRVRIAVQLIDALKGYQLFSERYDRELKDIFALQDEITMKVMTGMGSHTEWLGNHYVSSKGTTNLDAYLKWMQAAAYTQNFNKENAVIARRLAKESLTLDPEYADPYTVLAAANIIEVYVGASTSPRESFAQAEEMVGKALALDDSHVIAHTQLSIIYVFKGQFEKALLQAERAIAIAPNSAFANFVLGSAFLHSERFEEAISYFKKSLRLNPTFPFSQCLNNLGSAYRFLGRYDEAIAAYKKLFQFAPDHLPGHANLAATYVMAGREEDARGEAAEVMRIDPKFSLERFASSFPYRKELVEELTHAWRKAGLK